MSYLKGYMKVVKAALEKKNPERVEAFQTGAAAYAKKIISDFDNFEFYTGASQDVDGMVALLNYRVGYAWHLP